MLVGVCVHGEERKQKAIFVLPHPHFLNPASIFQSSQGIQDGKDTLERFSFLDPSLPLPGALSLRGDGHQRQSRDGTDQGGTDGRGRTFC